jgi:hypothetical protein
MNSWETILTFNLPQDAYLARAFLESRGIKSLITDELTTQINHLYSNSIGGVKIKVAANDIEEAIHILKEGGYLQEDAADLTKIEDLESNRFIDKTVCPYCKSKNIGYKKDQDYITAIIYFLSGVLFPIFRKSQVCFECKKQWKYRKRKK